MMERGADRFFAAIPHHADTSTPPDVEAQLAATARLLAEHPAFLRLVYLLALERSDDPAVSAAVRRVRDTAVAGFRVALATLLPRACTAAQGDSGGRRTHGARDGDVRRRVHRRPRRVRFHGRRTDVPAAAPSRHRPATRSCWRKNDHQNRHHHRSQRRAGPGVRSRPAGARRLLARRAGRPRRRTRRGRSGRTGRPRPVHGHGVRPRVAASPSANSSRRSRRQICLRCTPWSATPACRPWTACSTPTTASN